MIVIYRQKNNSSGRSRKFKTLRRPVQAICCIIHEENKMNTSNSLAMGKCWDGNLK